MPGKTGHLGLLMLMLAMAVDSCYLSFASIANIVRVFMTITLTVSDLNLFRVFISGADHSLGANGGSLKGHILALIMGLTLTSLSLKLLKRRMSLTSTDLLLTCPGLTSFTAAPGMSIDSPEEKIVLQAMEVTQGQCQDI